ncbi:UNVERIFIED_CONTAM: hypothetical protein ABIC26_004560 [Paenibacillus sp. PvR008]
MLIHFFLILVKIYTNRMYVREKGRTEKAGDALEEKIPGETPAFILKDVFINRKRNARMIKPMSLVKVIGPMKSQSSFVLPNVITGRKKLSLRGRESFRGRRKNILVF